MNMNQGKTKITGLQSWKIRLLLNSTVMVLLALLIFSVAAFFRTREALTVAYSNGIESTTEALSTDLEKWLQSHINFTTYLADDPAIQSMDPARYQPILQSGLKQFPTFSFFIVLTPDGMEQYNSANTQGAAGLKNLADRAYFISAVAGDTVMMDPVVSRTTGKAVIVIATPIKSDGKIVGVLAAPVQVDTINQQMTSASKGETGEAYLVNSKGVFLTPSRFTDELIAKELVKESAVLELTNESTGALQVISGNMGVEQYSNYREQQVIGAYHPIEVQNAKWGLLVEQNAI